MLRYPRHRLIVVPLLAMFFGCLSATQAASLSQETGGSPPASQDPVRSSADSEEILGFVYKPGRMQVGRVYHYRKSNVDGTNASLDDLYVASETRLESFKWTPGQGRATLVMAELDWKTFSVVRFETVHVFKDGNRQPVVLMKRSKDGKTLVAKGPSMQFQTPIVQLPWHSYDFDFASLNLSLRFLEDPELFVSFSVMDRHNGKFQHKGEVELSYADDEERHGILCRRYLIDGPGLEDRGGYLWVRRSDDPIIVDYEIDLPDEPGMKSGKLQLLGQDQLSREAWNKHILARLN